MSTAYHVLLINGPNLNLLGIREPNIYGSKSLSEIISDLNETAISLDLKLTHFQSNAEHELIQCIHHHNKANFIIINPGAFTHTSIALRDAFLAIKIVFIEIHLSNIYKREKFRHHSYLSDIALGVVCGFGIDGYHFALKIAHKYLFTH